MSHYVILCGGRDHPRFTERQRDWLDSLHAAHPFIEVITGGASGADEEGRDWARSRGVNCVTFWPNWMKFGQRAGPERNARMLRYIMARSFHVKHDYLALALVIAFPGGRGTADMCRQAREAGVEVIAWPHTP